MSNPDTTEIGTVRVIANRTTECTRIEVWTGLEWVILRGVQEVIAKVAHDDAYVRMSLVAVPIEFIAEPDRITLERYAKLRESKDA